MNRQLFNAIKYLIDKGSDSSYSASHVNCISPETIDKMRECCDLISDQCIYSFKLNGTSDEDLLMQIESFADDCIEGKVFEKIDYSYYQSLPKLKQEQATAIWSGIKDSDSETDWETLVDLYIRLTVQEVQYVCKKRHWNELYVGSSFDKFEIVSFCITGDMSRAFFWVDLHDMVNEKGRSMHIRLSNDKLIQTDSYERVLEMILHADEKEPKEKIIQIVSNETGEDEKNVRTVYNKVQREKRRIKEEERILKKLRDLNIVQNDDDGMYLVENYMDLSEGGRKLIAKLYGFRDGQQKTRAEVAKLFGITEEKVQYVNRKFKGYYRRGCMEGSGPRRRKLKEYLDSEDAYLSAPE